MAKTPSTLVTCNTQALSRAADALCARASGLSKNSVLGCLARAIAGPEHDWGFIKNAPSGHFTQPGLPPVQAPADAPAPTEVWVLTYDQDSDWAPRAPRVFMSRAAGLQAVRDDHSTWRHPEHPLEAVLHRLEEFGEYTISDHDEDADDPAPQLQIWLQPLAVETEAPGREDRHAQPSAVGSYDDQVDTLVLFEAPKARQGSLVGWSETFFLDVADFEAYLAKLEGHSERDKDYLRDRITPANQCEIIAEFCPEQWINKTACPVHPEGEESWRVDPDEIDPEAWDNDYLQHTRNAPAWAREWSGPFEITLDISRPDPAI